MKNSKKTGIIRNLDDLGRIVIPKEFRKKLNLNNNESVEIELIGNSVIVKKPTDTCLHCGKETSQTAKEVGIEMCDHCITIVSKLKSSK